MLWTVANILVNRRHEARIGFADCAVFLVISQTSMEDVLGRLVAEGEPVDVTKSRANMVVSGAERAFKEDFCVKLEVSGSSHGSNGGKWWREQGETFAGAQLRAMFNLERRLRHWQDGHWGERECVQKADEGSEGGSRGEM